MLPTDLADLRLPLTRLAGASVGLVVFACMILRGLLVGNSVETILIRALWGITAGTIIGLIAGRIADHIIRDHAAARPDVPASPPTASNDGVPAAGA